MIFLAQKDESVELLKSEKRIHCDPGMERALKILTTADGRYAEIVLHGPDGWRVASVSGAMADQVPVNVNYAWKAIRAPSFLSGDTQLAEFAVAVTGTLIVTAPTSDSDTSGPRVRILEPLALDRRVTEVLMEGGGAL